MDLFLGVCSWRFPVVKVLLYILLLCSSGCGVHARLQNGFLPGLGEKYTVCTGQSPPFVSCSLNDSSVTPTGYSIEVWKAAAVRVGLKPADYQFVCMEFDDLEKDLTDPSGICDVAAEDLAFTVALNEAGIPFGYPEYHSGQQIVVHAQFQTSSQWVFFKPFTWQVWVFIVGAAIAVGLSIHVVDVISKRHSPERILADLSVFGESGFVNRLWAATASVVNLQNLRAVSSPARFIIFVWFFCLLALLTMYTGNSAAFFTAASINTNIQSINDLRGRNWGAYVGSTPVLGNYGLIPPVQYEWNTDADAELFLNDLRSDKVEALVLGCAYTDYITSMDCSLHKVGDCFALDTRGLLFWQNASEAVVAQFYSAVLALEESSSLERLKNVLVSPASTCNVVASSMQAVTINQISGLGIILAAAIFVAFLAALVVHQFNEKKYVASVVQKLRSSSLGGRSLRSVPASSIGANIRDNVEKP